MAQECPTCGQTYGITHSCPGAIASTSLPPEKEWTPPSHFAPFFYLREAMGVARFDDGAIKAAANDEMAFAYGAFLWLVGRLLIYGVPMWPRARAAMRGYEVNWAPLIVGLIVVIFIDAMVFCVQYGIAHLLARWWFGARGSYVAILRAMLMGSIVLWIYPVPVVGPLAAGLWMIAVLMRVFEEVDGIERMKAFGLSFGIGVLFWFVTLSILASRHH